MNGGARAHSKVDRALAPIGDMKGSPDVGLFALDEPTLFLVDGNNLLWRSAHSTPAPFRADDGRDLTTLFRFFVKLRRALGTYGLFAECIVCFDGAEAWRDRLTVDATYKANRSYDNADLSFMGWLPEIRAALDAVGITSVEVATSEADDVIATLHAQVTPRPVRIMSTDRDYYQLIGPATTVLSSRERPSLVTAAVVEERYGVKPSSWLDARTIAGDPSDGIPGIKGIGMKTAAAMLAGGLTLEDLRARGEAAVVQRWDDLMRWRELIRPRTDINLDVETSGRPTPRLPSPSAVCEQLGLVARRAPRTRTPR